MEDDKQQMIRIAICDDEKRFCLELEKYILKYEFINDIEIEIKKFYTGEDLIEFIKKRGSRSFIFRYRACKNEWYKCR